jgi:dihydrofolate synthase/folylpolyglutamate synthase
VPIVNATERYLDQRARFGVKFGLDTMRALLAALGHPERSFPVLVVAGTNGKGSVTAYVDAALGASGLRCGRYTSPHLVRVNERIAVGGRPVGDAGLARAVGAVRDAASALVREGALPDHPTHFEVLTAAGLVHFRAARVEAAVLEVGLGGRLDATNACAPLCSAIVSVDFDHEAHLGDTLAAIAREKAGVLRRGRVTVVGTLPSEAREAVGEAARALGARLVDAAEGVRVTEARGGLVVRTPRHTYRGVRPLPGRHQRDNAVVALRLLEAAREAGLGVDLGRCAAGLSRARWPGRLQRVPGRPPLLLDGAHNPAGARALADALRGGPPFVLVFGAMADKDVAGMAAALFPLARVVVLTQPPGERAATPAEVARRAPAPLALLEPRVGRALALARRRARAGERVVVAGSLFLVGDVLRRLSAAKPSPTASRAAAARPRAGAPRSASGRPRRRRPPRARKG